MALAEPSPLWDWSSHVFEEYFCPHLAKGYVDNFVNMGGSDINKTIIIVGVSKSFDE